MWKAVGCVPFEMDAWEVYQAIVKAGEAGSVVSLSASGVRYTCWPRLGGAQAGQYCILLEASLGVEPPPGMPCRLPRTPRAAAARAVKSRPPDLVAARLIVRQMRPGYSEGILEIVPCLEPFGEDARRLINQVAQHLNGPALHELCELLMEGLLADGSKGLAEAQGALSPKEAATVAAPEVDPPAERERRRNKPKHRAAAGSRLGRPRAQEDDWVHEQVDGLGRDPMDVFREWLSCMPRARRRRLKDPYRSFKFALASRRKRARNDGAGMLKGKRRG